MHSDSYPRGILAPYIKEDRALGKKIEQLRNEGQIVIIALPGHENDVSSFNCDKKLVSEDGVWSIVDV